MTDQIREYDAQLAYLQQLEVDRLHCIFSHVNEDVSLEDQMGIPTNDDGTSYIK